jgi:hypothetical protein
MGGAWRQHGEKKKYMQDFGEKARRKKNDYLDVSRMIILKWILGNRMG